MIRVNYNGLIADIRDEELEAGLAELSQCSRSERRRIMHSVQKELEKSMKLTDSGRVAFTEQQLKDTANDIGLWFANEVIEGRAENYKVKVQ